VGADLLFLQAQLRVSNWLLEQVSKSQYGDKLKIMGKILSGILLAANDCFYA
jgi:hypothetical protein